MYIFLGWGPRMCAVERAYLLPSSVPVKFSASQVELRLALLPLYSHPPPPHPPTWASIFEPLLDYLGSWNLELKCYSTKLGQLGFPSYIC